MNGVFEEPLFAELCFPDVRRAPSKVTNETRHGTGPGFAVACLSDLNHDRPFPDRGYRAVREHASFTDESTLTESAVHLVMLMTARLVQDEYQRLPHATECMYWYVLPELGAGLLTKLARRLEEDAASHAQTCRTCAGIAAHEQPRSVRARLARDLAESFLFADGANNLEVSYRDVAPEVPFDLCLCLLELTFRHSAVTPRRRIAWFVWETAMQVLEREGTQG